MHYYEIRLGPDDFSLGKHGVLVDQFDAIERLVCRGKAFLLQRHNVDDPLQPLYLCVEDTCRKYFEGIISQFHATECRKPAFAVIRLAGDILAFGDWGEI